MTTYITITDPETDPDAPLTSELAKKWRDNAIAIGEGDTTAPVNAACWHPYNKVFANDSNNGKFYDFAVDGALQSVETPAFVDGFEYRVRVEDLSHNSGASQSFEFELYRETGAAYNPIIDVFGALVAGTSLITGTFEMPSVRLSSNVHLTSFAVATSGGWTNAAIVVTAPIVLRNLFATAGKASKARFGWSTTATFDSGRMFLDKRRVYS